MAEQRSQSRNEGSPTGAYPSVPDAAQPYEPAMPKSLPEVPDLAGATGMFPIVSEGEDITRQRDDSASNVPDDSTAKA